MQNSIKKFLKCKIWITFEKMGPFLVKKVKIRIMHILTLVPFFRPLAIQNETSLFQKNEKGFQKNNIISQYETVDFFSQTKFT